MHLIQKPVKFCLDQKIIQAIGNYLVNKHISKIYFFSNCLISNLILLNIDELYLRVKNKDIGKNNSTLIVFSQKDYTNNKG